MVSTPPFVIPIDPWHSCILSMNCCRCHVSLSQTKAGEIFTAIIHHFANSGIPKETHFQVLLHSQCPHRGSSHWLPPYLTNLRSPSIHLQIPYSLAARSILTTGFANSSSPIRKPCQPPPRVLQSMTRLFFLPRVLPNSFSQSIFCEKSELEC